MCVEHVRRSETVRLSESHYSSYNGYENKILAVISPRSSSSSSSSSSLISDTGRGTAVVEGRGSVFEVKDVATSSGHNISRSNMSFLNSMSGSSRSHSRSASCPADTRRVLRTDNCLSFREYVAAAMIRRYCSVPSLSDSA